LLIELKKEKELMHHDYTTDAAGEKAQPFRFE